MYWPISYWVVSGRVGSMLALCWNLLECGILWRCWCQNMTSLRSLYYQACLSHPKKCIMLVYWMTYLNHNLLLFNDVFELSENRVTKKSPKKKSKTAQRWPITPANILFNWLAILHTWPWLSKSESWLIIWFFAWWCPCLIEQIVLLAK